MSRTLVDAAREALGPSPERALAAIRMARYELERVEENQVGAALAAGWSWARIGRALGVSRQAVHRKYSSCPPKQSALRAPFFTSPARVALLIARTEASARGDAVAGTEHALLGLLQQGDGAAADVLRAEGASLRLLRAAADRLTPCDLCRTPPSQIPFSRRMARALESCARAARSDGPRVCDDDLLDAILADRDSGASWLLEATDVSRRDVLAALAADRDRQLQAA